MRTYILYGALALTGCAAPEQAFPSLAALPTPEAPKVSEAQRESDMKALQAKGDVTRAEGKRVQAGGH